MKSFKQYLTEQGLDSVAGVAYGDNTYRYNVRDLVNHTRSSKFKNISLRHFQNIESQIDRLDPVARQARIDQADPGYPIVVMRHQVPGSAKHQYQVLDGTHRVGAALAAGKKRIAAKLVDPGHMEKFRVSQVGEDDTDDTDSAPPYVNYMHALPGQLHGFQKGR